MWMPWFYPKCSEKEVTGNAMNVHINPIKSITFMNTLNLDMYLIPVTLVFIVTKYWKLELFTQDTWVNVSKTKINFKKIHVQMWNSWSIQKCTDREIYGLAVNVAIDQTRREIHLNIWKWNMLCILDIIVKYVQRQ